MCKNKELNDITQEDGFDITLLYKYLGDPTVRTHYINEWDWDILQKQLEKLKQANNQEEVDKLLSDMYNK